MKFLSGDFLLSNSTARRLYHDYAKEMPIYDYHCHLPVQEIAENRQFENLTRLWLAGDHQKWRAMRTNGVDERLITGDATDWEKFLAWAQTVPVLCTIRNSLYNRLYRKRFIGNDGEHPPLASPIKGGDVHPTILFLSLSGRGGERGKFLISDNVYW